MTLTERRWQLAWCCAWAGSGCVSGLSPGPNSAAAGPKSEGLKDARERCAGDCHPPVPGGGPQTWLGTFGIPFSCGGFSQGGAVGLLRAPSSGQVRMRYPSPLWHAGELGTGRGGHQGGPRRDEQGHRVEAGKVVRTRSLNLN